MANEVLNKTAQKLRIIRPDCKVLSFNWGPWDGGMVNSSLRNVFLQEGIGLIPLKSGSMQPIVEFSNPDESNVETFFGTTDINTNVYAYQFMGVFMMPIVENWEVNIGTGLSYTTTRSEAFGVVSKSTDGASTSMISTAYYFPVMKDSRLGGEFRFTALPKYGDYIISLAISFAYKFLEY